MNGVRTVTHVPLAALLALAVALAAPLPAGAVPHAGDPAPSFSAPDASGGTVSNANYQHKALYLNFFASWCVPCNEEAPSVSSLFAKYHAKGLNVVGVNELEDKSKAQGFAAKYKWPFAIAVDDGSVGRAFGVVGLPVHIFIDRHGNVSTFRLGEMDPGEIEAAIKKIL
jgi:cytochrome c biogenesis protein CcmG/thiol:disulfide interchange protein DsbE